jgi:hypothetical protein
MAIKKTGFPLRKNESDCCEEYKSQIHEHIVIGDTASSNLLKRKNDRQLFLRKQSNLQIKRCNTNNSKIQQIY